MIVEQKSSRMAENVEDCNGLELTILKSLANFLKIHERWRSSFKLSTILFLLHHVQNPYTTWTPFTHNLLETILNNFMRLSCEQTPPLFYRLSYLVKWQETPKLCTWLPQRHLLCLILPPLTVCLKWLTKHYSHLHCLKTGRLEVPSFPKSAKKIVQQSSNVAPHTNQSQLTLRWVKNAYETSDQQERSLSRCL